MKKILLIRFSSIGDIVLTTPVVRAIKTQLTCDLHVVTKKQYASLYQNNPYINKVHEVEHDLNKTVALLKAENYDFVVDLHKNLRSIKIKKALKAPSASFPKVNIQKWLLVNLKMNFLPETHLVGRYFEAVKPLGVTNDGKGLDFFIPENDIVNLETVNAALSQGYIGFVIGGQHFTKIFPPEKVAEVINRIKLPVVLLGGEEDFIHGEDILNLTPGKQVINSCGKFNLNQSASLVKQCSVLITNDTGLMHIGAAFNKPIISIWGNTTPAFGMYPYMPGNEKNFFISEVQGLYCRPCSKLGHKKCPKKHFRCMLEQNIEMIVEKVHNFLAARN